MRQLILQGSHVTYREIETALIISGTSIHSTLNEHFTVKKIFHVVSHTICQSLKKRLVGIGRKKCSKNTIAVLRNTSMILWQVVNRGFTLISLKVNSSRLYGCFKKSQIQQMLVAHEAFSSKWPPVFHKNWTFRNRNAKTTQNSQSWLVHNDWFSGYLPKN